MVEKIQKSQKKKILKSEIFEDTFFSAKQNAFLLVLPIEEISL